MNNLISYARYFSVNELTKSAEIDLILARKEFTRLPDWCVLTNDVKISLSSVIPKPKTSHDAWIEISCEAEFSTLCQRCLDEMIQKVSFIIRGKKKSGDQKNYYFSGDEFSEYPLRYCKNGQLDILRLCEDEILLCLPMVPKHASECLTDEFDSPKVTNKSNPFSLLAKFEDKN